MEHKLNQEKMNKFTIKLTGSLLLRFFHRKLEQGLGDMTKISHCNTQLFLQCILITVDLLTKLPVKILKTA